MISTTAQDLLLKDKSSLKLFMGCPILDHAIGGIPVQGITEISGAAGCCKTQFCLQLALQAQLSMAQGGLDGESLYFSCSEGPFPIRRLQQMSSHFEARHGKSVNFLSRVHINECYSLEELYSCLNSKVPEMCRESKVRLLLIDSLAGLVRYEYDNKSAKDMQQRTAQLFRVAARLKWLADIHHLCIVVVNQVTANGIDSNWDSYAKDKPALGMAWSHCVNTRIALERLSGGYDLSGVTDTFRPSDGYSESVDEQISGKSSVRLLRLVFSPCRPAGECRFVVDERGVGGVE